MKEKSEDERLLRLRQVLELVPVGRSTWLNGVRSGRFPKPVKQNIPGAAAVFWRLSDIKKLIESFQ